MGYIETGYRSFRFFIKLCLITIWDILKLAFSNRSGTIFPFNNNMGYIETQQGERLDGTPLRLITIWDILKPAIRANDMRIIIV